MLRALPVVLPLVLPAAARAQERVGDTYEIRMESETETSGDTSSGSSSSRQSLQERVVAIRDDGVELEFDFPEGTSPESRDRTWQFPARVLASPGRPLQLLNSSELEARVPAWLERGGLTEAACGRWIFTWTAIKIECDPASVLGMIESFNLRLGDLRHGALYQEPGARTPAPLRTRSIAGRQVLVAEMEIDPEAVRHARAAMDVAVGEIMGEPVTLETALQTWAAKEISGTVTTTLEQDAEGRVTGRTTIVSLLIVDANGSRQNTTTTITTERRRISP